MKMSKMNGILILAILIWGAATCTLIMRNIYLSKEKERYRTNTDALMSDMQQIQIDSATLASTVKVLRLSLDEYEQYRAEDAAIIKKMGVRIKSLEAVAKHNVEVNVPIEAEVKDSVIFKDTIPVYIRSIKMNTPYIKLDGIMEDNRLNGKIHLPVHLHQAVWVEYKHRFLWWRWKIKAIHQTISSDNPFVEIKYSEFINIRM